MLKDTFSKLKDKGIDNIIIYVSDSLRWDFLPKSVKELGLVTKTVASSLYTASSFPSMVNGLYPPKHGVDTWEDKLSKGNRGLLEVSGYNISFRCETTWVSMGPEDSQVHRVFGKPSGKKLEDLKEPFIYLEDDKGGHCPYGFSFEEYDGDCDDFFKEYGKKDRKKLIEKYSESISESTKNFKKRLKTIEEMGIEDNTLVVFTSDHGELLGEYGGLAGHGKPPCPELVYVPTVFIHPTIDQNTIEDNIIRHVDLFPTLMNIIGKKLDRKVDGVDLSHETPKVGMSFKKGGFLKKEGQKLKKFVSYKTNSIWDHDGGHVFHDMNNLPRRIFDWYKISFQDTGYRYLTEQNKKHNWVKRISNYRKALDHLTKRHIEYGSSSLKKEVAREILNHYLDEAEKYEERDKLNRAIEQVNIDGV